MSEELKNCPYPHDAYDYHFEPTVNWEVDCDEWSFYVECEVCGAKGPQVIAIRNYDEPFQMSEYEEKAKCLWNSIVIEDKSKISDGYHTFEELYEHRNLLFLRLLEQEADSCRWSGLNPLGWWSRRHDDGSMYEGYIVVGMYKSTPAQITYHMSEKYIELIQSWLPELERAPEWDGHTPDDVLQRLKLAIK